MECGDRGGCNRIFSNTSAVEAIYQSMSAPHPHRESMFGFKVTDDSS